MSKNNISNCTDHTCPLLKPNGTGCTVTACIKPQSNVSDMVDNATKGKNTKTKNKTKSNNSSTYVLEQKMLSARNAVLQAEKETNELMQFIQDMYPELELDLQPTKAENASNLEESILCYINHGEYNAKALVRELQRAVEEQ